MDPRKKIWALLSLSLVFFFTTFFLSPLSVDSPLPPEDLSAYEAVDKNCPFRDSPLYRSIFVYPNPHTETEWFEKYRSNSTANSTTFEWPWILQRDKIKRDGTFMYNIDDPSLTQFSLDLVVYEIIASSCLRTWNPETAKLFFVPFLSSVFRRGGDPKWAYDAVPRHHTSPFEEALAFAMEGESFQEWETVYGLTSRYWKRNKGTDHVVVMPEPCHGLYHPQGKRGFHHYIKTQKQLLAPVVISVEVSRTFVETYPECSQKNVLVPYPNIDGRWYNGHWEEQVQQLKDQYNQPDRPLSVYYSAGNHGECLELRKALNKNHQCEIFADPLQHMLSRTPRNSSFPLGTRMATFCPCPGGDTPSAKRMFDAILAGCIPVVLSHDFIWPFTSSSKAPMNPADFSLRLESSQYSHVLYEQTGYHRNGTTRCERTTHDKESVQEFLRRTASADEITRLQHGLRQAAQAYSFFEPIASQYATNPLRDGVVPSGGAAIRLVEELALRAETGKDQWNKCQQEKDRVLKQTGGRMVHNNKC